VGDAYEFFLLLFRFLFYLLFLFWLSVVGIVSLLAGWRLWFLSLSVSLCLSVSLRVSPCLSVSLRVPPSIRVSLCVSVSVCLCVCVSVCLCVCVLKQGSRRLQVQVPILLSVSKSDGLQQSLQLHWLGSSFSRPLNCPHLENSKRTPGLAHAATTCHYSNHTNAKRGGHFQAETE
jgi:hypothetical protein